MLVIVFILITTLIGLDNFYRSKKQENRLLNNNYFIWKMLLIILIIFSIGVFISDIWNKNKEEFMLKVEDKVTEYILKQEN